MVKANQYIDNDDTVSNFSWVFRIIFIIIFYKYVFFFFLNYLLLFIYLLKVMTNIEHFLFYVLILQIVYVHRL